MRPAAISPDGLEIGYDVAGSGWREQMTAFAAPHVVVVVDLAGRGVVG